MGSAKVAAVADSDEDINDRIVLAPPRLRRDVQVVIPAISVDARRSMAARISSTKSSSSDSSRAESVDPGVDDTPATSIAVTPDVSVDGRRTTKTGKRSRLSIESTIQVEDNSSEDADEKLARILQEEEYAEVDQIRPKKKSKLAKGHKTRIMDSEDEDLSGLDDTDDLSSVDTSQFVFKKPQVPIKKKGKGTTRAIVPDSDGEEEMDYETGLANARAGKKAARVPARRASAAARKSLSRSIKSTIPDSESELSVLATDVGTDDDFVSDNASSVLSELEASSDDDTPLALSRPGGASNSAASAPSSLSAVGRSLRRSQNSRDVNPEDYVEFGSMRRIRERKKLEKAHPAIKTMWNDLDAAPRIKLEPAAQPKSINRKLKSFQLEGLDWMTKMEKTHWKGGLLGDEMGMGKTIQAVSLIMSDYPQKQPTLVLVPPVALMQWASEIGEYTDGTLKVLVYHGQNAKVKKMKRKELLSYDVIMISYNSLESLYRKQEKGWSRGEDLIKEASPIHDIHFHRLILDEAHSIKTRTTGIAKACFALKGSFKWCLSGTPVQNRIGEFFSLLRFLEVRPFADYFCKKCPCSILHWELNEDHRCTACKHAGMEHVSVFNQELLNPLTQSESKEVREKAMDKLQMITSRIMLRRMKRDYTSSMELPPKEVIVHNEFFGETERDFSSSIMTNTTRQFDTYVSRGVMLNNYANIFGLIMQMRQVANHPDLLLKKHAAEGQNVLVCNICDEPAEEAIRSKCRHDFCRSCVKNFVQSVEASGGDADCPRCHIPLAIDFDQPDLEQNEEDVKKSSIINRIKMGEWTSSTKIEMLVYDLYKLRSKKQTLKSIVFSQFTSMLQLIEWRLRRAGFNTVMLDGSMTPIQRERSIKYFMTNPDVEVFLVSLKAGGVALNLTEASRVFIVDPWWNPAAEWQSADRCHRIGQKRPCVITRLCIEDSVESRMVMLQEKKANMINGTINNDKVAMEKLTPEDMQFLFRGS